MSESVSGDVGRNVRGIAFLRDATRTAHDAVDAAFARFSLADRADYTRMLVAHARALAAAEAALAGDAALPRWHPRLPLLAADLADLGAGLPPPLAFDPPATRAGRLGMLYVVEGSRLGGVMLARGVAAGLPARYLSARHGPGDWRALLAAIDADAAASGPDWQPRARAGALATFALYRTAADTGG